MLEKILLCVTALAFGVCVSAGESILIFYHEHVARLLTQSEQRTEKSESSKQMPTLTPKNKKI
jgi:hypothetical protein